MKEIVFVALIIGIPVLITIGIYLAAGYESFKMREHFEKKKQKKKGIK